MLVLPPSVGVKLQLIVSDTIAADGSPLEWLSIGDSSSEREYSSSDDCSNYSDEEADSIMMSDTDNLLFKSSARSNKIRDSIALFENGPNNQNEKMSTMRPSGVSIREKINQFNSPTKLNSDRRNSKMSLHSQADSGVSSAALTMSATSFNSRSISLTSNSNSEGEGQNQNSRFQFKKVKAQTRSTSGNMNRDGRRTIRSASATSIDRSIRSSSSGRMSRGAERERLKLEKLMNGSFMRSLTPKRARSQDGIINRNVKNELKTIEHQERARAAVRNEKLNKKRWQSEPRKVGKTLAEPVIIETAPLKNRYQLDEQKQEIRISMPAALELEKLVNLKTASAEITGGEYEIPEVQITPKSTITKNITVTERKSGKGQKIVIEETETIHRKPMKGAQVTNKPLKPVQLSQFQPFCFEILHKNGRPISNLFIMPNNDDSDFYSVPRIRLMVECNRMRYFAVFHPQQRMEHLKTLIYVLTGVMPRNQCLFYRQRMDSKLPFEGLLEGEPEEIKETRASLDTDLARFMKNDNNVLRSASGSFSITASSDEAYGSDKSVSGDDGQKRGRTESEKNVKSSRAKSSDVRAGKFLNQLRGQKFSGLIPEDFSSSTGELKESDFFTSYMVLLKDRRLSDEEHDARCDLLSYMQTKMDSYNWKVIRNFHDQVVKNWERGLVCFDGDLETFKRHYFDGHPSKMKKPVYSQSRPQALFNRNLRRSTQRIIF